MMDGWMIMNGVGGRHVAWGFIHLTTDGRVRATGQGQGTAGSHGHGHGGGGWGRDIRSGTTTNIWHSKRARGGRSRAERFEKYKDK